MYGEALHIVYAACGRICGFLCGTIYAIKTYDFSVFLNIKNDNI
jgi:hypothetical protein